MKYTFKEAYEKFIVKYWPLDSRIKSWIQAVGINDVDEKIIVYTKTKMDLLKPESKQWKLDGWLGYDVEVKVSGTFRVS